MRPAFRERPYPRSFVVRYALGEPMQPDRRIRAISVSIRIHPVDQGRLESGF